MPKRIAFLKFSIIAASSVTAMSAIAPALPAIRTAFESQTGADLLVKLVLTLPALFIAVSSPIAGIAIDRWGAKPVMAGSLILYGISGSSGLYLGSLFIILASRAFLGMAVAGIITSCTVLIGDHFVEKERDTFIGYQFAFMALGGVFMMIAGGILADIHWRAPFVVYLASFAILPSALYPMPHTFPARSDARVVSGNGISKFEIIRRFLPIYMLTFLSMVLFYMIPAFVPFYMDRFLEVTGTKIGIAVASEALIGAIVSSRYRFVRHYLGVNAIFFLLFGFMGAGFAMIFLANSYIQIIIAMFIVGLGVGLLQPNINNWVLLHADISYRGKAIGGLNASFFLGQFFCPVLMQPLSNLVGLESAFGTAGLILFAIMFFFIATLLREKKYSRLNSNHRRIS